MGEFAVASRMLKRSRALVELGKGVLFGYSRICSVEFRIVTSYAAGWSP
jgi:hypothetical protein